MSTPRFRSGLFLAVVVLTTAGSQGQNPAEILDLRAPGFIAAAREGFDHIYSLDYDLALERFGRMRAGHPGHPGPPFYMATAIWLGELFERRDLELDKFVAPGYFDEADDDVGMGEQERGRFFDLVETAQGLSEEILERDPDNLDARYFLASTHGLLATFAFTVDHDRSEALRQGSRANGMHEEIVEIDPDYHDSYLSLGVYEYVVDNLPWYVKWIAFLAGHSGDEDRGFIFLERAAEQSRFVRKEADIVRMVLLVREEEYAEALAIARDLHSEYPRNFLLHLCRAQILDRMDRQAEAAQTYRQVVRYAEAGRPNYDRIDLPELQYRVGVRLAELGRASEALRELEAVAGSREATSLRRAEAHLRAGEILVDGGRPSRAVAHYEAILALRGPAEELFDEFEDTVSEARDRLEDLTEE